MLYAIYLTENNLEQIEAFPTAPTRGEVRLIFLYINTYFFKRSNSIESYLIIYAVEFYPSSTTRISNCHDGHASPLLYQALLHVPNMKPVLSTHQSAAPSLFSF